MSIPVPDAAAPWSPGRVDDLAPSHPPEESYASGPRLRLLERGEPGVVTVVVAHDEVLTRMGICSVLQRSGDIEVVGEAGSGRAAMELVRRHRPQVLLVKLLMAPIDGLAVTESIRELSPATGVIVLASDPPDDLIFSALRTGVAGFLVKGDVPAELTSAVRAVAGGQAALSPCVTRRVLNRLVHADIESVTRARTMIDTLTRREHEVLEHLAKGMGNAAIGRALYLSEGAVKANVSRLLIKLGCTNRVGAAAVFHDAQLRRECRPAAPARPVAGAGQLRTMASR
jgi:DNA-binding NarL/FixJ family response regulator